MASASLIWDLFAKDQASPAFLRLAGAADKAAASTERATKGLAVSTARMGKMGADLTKHLTLPLLAVAGVSVDQAMKFQKSMTLIQTAGGETAAKAAAISVGIKKIATSTGTTLGQLGEGIYTVAKAGATKWSAAGQLEVLKAAAQGAKAEAVPLGVAVDALSTIMFDYGAKTSDAVKYENMLIRGSGLAKTSMQEYASSLSNVVPIAATVGLSFEQVGGAIATMTQHGMSAQQSTENLRNLISNLAGQNNVATAAMQQLGINTVDLSKNLGHRGLTGTLAIVDKALRDHTKNGMVVIDVHKAAALATKSLGTELGTMSGKLKDQSAGLLNGKTSIKQYTKDAKNLGGTAGASALQFLALYKSSMGFSDQLRSGKGTYTTTVAALQKMLGGITGAGVAMQLGGQYAGQFSTNTKAIGKAALEAGSDVLGWNKTQDTLAVKMDKAKASLQVLAVEIGTALIPAVSKIVDGVSKAVHWFDSLSSSGKKVLLWSAGIMLALGPILTIGGRLTVVGRSIAGFAATAATKISTLAGASEATAAKVGNITRGMVRGVTGILAGAAASQVGGNSGGGWLTSIMLGTAGGWALGGPVGAALGGVSAAIFKGVGLWNDHKNAAKQAAAQEVAFIGTLTSAITTDNGALGANLRLTVTKALQSKGVLDAAQKLGVSLSAVVDAAMGNKGALQSSISGPEGALEARMAALQAKLRKPGLTQEQAQPIQGQIQAVYKQITAYEALRSQLGLTAGDVAKAKKQFDQAAHAMNDGRVATGSYSTQLAALRHHTSLSLDANGQLNASLSTTTVVGEHNRMTLVRLIEAAKGQAQTTADNAAKNHSLTDSLIIGNKALSKNETALRKAAIAAGLPKAEVDKLIYSMGVLNRVTPHPRIGVDTSQAAQKAAAIQRQIDRIQQNKVPGIKANTVAASNAIFNLQAQLDALRSKTVTITAVTKGNLQGTYNQQVPYAARQHKAMGGGVNDGYFTVGERGWELGYKRGNNVQIFDNNTSQKMTGMARVPGYASGTASAVGTSIGSFLAATHNIMSTAKDLAGAAKDLAGAAKLQRQMARDSSRLTSLGALRDSVRARLGTPTTTATTAYDRLATARQAYTDARTSVATAVGGFDIATAGQSVYSDQPGGSASAILTQISAAAAKATQYAGLLKKLGREGLNKVLLMQLASAGPQAFDQAQALAAATPAQIGQINGAETQLTAAGNAAGKYVADRFYLAGVQSAQGLVNGLLSQENALNKAIRHLGDQMVGTLKHKLGIKSPSRVMHQLGVFTGQGFELGIRSRVPHVQSAAKDLANGALPGSQARAYAQGGDTHFHVHGIEDPVTFINRAEAKMAHRQRVMGAT
jgi:TP901 family phage tail tape measure protein